MLLQQSRVGPDIRHRDGLATAAVVGHGEHAKRDALALSLEQRLDSLQVDIALERIDQRWLQTFRDHQIDRLDADVFQVRAGRIEVGVVGHQVALFAYCGEQHLFGGAPLVGRHKVLHAGDVLDHRFQPVKAARPGVALVALHDGAPLPRRHGTGAGIGQPVDQYVFGAQLEHVELGRFQQLLPLRAGGHADGLDALDAKGFNQGFGHGGDIGVTSGDAKLSPPKSPWCRVLPTDRKNAGTCVYCPGSCRIYKE